jgi:adenine phosphoribosyltransferase
MKEYRMEIAGCERVLPFVDISEELAYASFVVISDTELIQKAAQKLAPGIRGCEVIVTAEAKGIALAYEISRLLGHRCFVVARKSEKSYMKESVGVEVNSITTRTPQHLFLDGSDRKRIENRKVCLLDDVVSTGDSLRALEELCVKAGAIIEKKACILAEGDAALRKDLIYLEKLPLFRKTGDKEYEVIQ